MNTTYNNSYLTKLKYLKDGCKIFKIDIDRK